MTRTNPEIRNTIIKSLKEYPKTVHEISVETEIRWETVKKHLEYLEDLGILERVRVKVRGTEEKELWKLQRGDSI